MCQTQANLDKLISCLGACGEKVDLLAANHEGLTALHEAVIYNRLEVAHALVQYGGQ